MEQINFRKRRRCFFWVALTLLVLQVVGELVYFMAEMRALSALPGTSGVDYLGHYFGLFVLGLVILMEVSLYYCIRYFLFCGNKKLYRTFFQILLLLTFGAMGLSPLTEWFCQIGLLNFDDPVVYQICAFGWEYAMLAHFALRIVYFFTPGWMHDREIEDQRQNS